MINEKYLNIVSLQIIDFDGMHISAVISVDRIEKVLFEGLNCSHIWPHFSSKITFTSEAIDIKS